MPRSSHEGLLEWPNGFLLKAEVPQKCHSALAGTLPLPFPNHKMSARLPTSVQHLAKPRCHTLTSPPGEACKYSEPQQEASSSWQDCFKRRQEEEETEMERKHLRLLVMCTHTQATFPRGPPQCSGDQEALDSSGLGSRTTPIQSRVPERKRPPFLRKGSTPPGGFTLSRSSLCPEADSGSTRRQTYSGLPRWAHHHHQHPSHTVPNLHATQPECTFLIILQEQIPKAYLAWQRATVERLGLRVIRRGCNE